MTREEIDKFVLANFNDMSKQKMADALNVPFNAVRSSWMRLGLRRDESQRIAMVTQSTRRADLDEQHRRLRESGLSNGEIAKAMGISRGMAWLRGRRLGLNDSDEVVNRRRSELRHEYLKSLSPEDKARHKEKRVASFHETRKREALRVQCGLAQRTNIKLRTLPRRVQMAKVKLVRVYSYLWFADEPYSLYYDDETDRLPAVATSGNKKHCEAYFAKKYGFVFKPADEDDD